MAKTLEKFSNQFISAMETFADSLQEGFNRHETHLTKETDT